MKHTVRLICPEHASIPGRSRCEHTVNQVPALGGNRFVPFVLILIAGLHGHAAAAEEFNYDQSRVPKYELPDPLAGVDSAEAWRSMHRARVLKLVAETVYGVRPDAHVNMAVASSSTREQDGMRRKLVTLRLSRNDKSLDLEMLIYLPASASGPVPLFVGLNFNGNHTITDDPDVPVTESWVRNDDKKNYVDNRASEQSRGTASSRWPYKAITARGYGLATIYYGDIDPDFHDGFKNGAHALFSDFERTPASWGSISAWAWGLSRAMDYFEQDADIDQTRVAVMGHSRLGKTSLWAGASDERFALVVSNDSGCGGAALSRRRFGETVKRINTSFPHWFCDNFKQYNDNEDKLPVDQHTLVSLIAPRPVLICSAEDDRWADPKGEFLSGLGADPVYRLLGTDGMAANEWPGVNTPILSRIGYHIRPGGHDVKMQDWKVYMDFADKHLGRR